MTFDEWVHSTQIEGDTMQALRSAWNAALEEAAKKCEANLHVEKSIVETGRMADPCAGTNECHRHDAWSILALKEKP